MEIKWQIDGRDAAVRSIDGHGLTGDSDVSSIYILTVVVGDRSGGRRVVVRFFIYLFFNNLTLVRLSEPWSGKLSTSLHRAVYI